MKQPGKPAPKPMPPMAVKHAAAPAVAVVAAAPAKPFDKAAQMAKADALRKPRKGRTAVPELPPDEV